MQETTFDLIEKMALDLQEQGKNWHFHMLSPDCVFNKEQDQHAFVFENISDGTSYVVYSNEANMKLGQKLVKMIHGDEIVREGSNPSTKNEKIKQIIERAKALNEKGIHWHNHMLFPDCAFNQNPVKWSILFEDPETGAKITALYDIEPLEDLSLIEVLYYAQR